MSHIQTLMDIYFLPTTEKHLLICYDQHLKTSKNLSETQVLPGRAVLCMVYARHSFFPTHLLLCYILYPKQMTAFLSHPRLQFSSAAQLCLSTWTTAFLWSNSLPWRSHKLLFAPSVLHRAAQAKVVHLGKKSRFSRSHTPRTGTRSTQRHSQQITSC